MQKPSGITPRRLLKQYSSEGPGPVLLIIDQRWFPLHIHLQTPPWRDRVVDPPACGIAVGKV
jgi:hypothetical protein